MLSPWMIWIDVFEGRRQLAFPSSWKARLLRLLRLLSRSPGACPALGVDAVEYVASVMVDVTEFAHHTEALRLRLDDTGVARSERPVEQSLTRLQPSVTQYNYIHSRGVHGNRNSHSRGIPMRFPWEWE